MTDFPILQRTRADLKRRLATMHRNDPRRGETQRALVDATCRLMRRQLTARKPVPTTDDLFALAARGPAFPQPHTEMRP
jgi:hypothetical protein